MKRICVALLLIGCLKLAAAQQVSGAGNVSFQLQFQTKVGDSLLQQNATYQNCLGEPFTVRSFKYYISHIQLQYEGGKQYALPMAPHLVNEMDSSSKTVLFTAPAGKITGIRFLLGIDSLTNTSGVQKGDLDPTKGMFWIWNTGYIMAKLEGTSSSSKAPGKQYSYDIGGYKPGESVARNIELRLSPLNDHASTFVITSDISKWFCGKHAIKIAEQAMCHSPGALAMAIADNYADMFSIEAK